jgi:hypothetical protein
MNFSAAADELRRQEFSRLSAAVTPRIEAFRSMTADAFRTEIALMLERLGHTVISSVTDIVTIKEGRKYITACATPTGGHRTICLKLHARPLGEERGHHAPWTSGPS